MSMNMSGLIARSLSIFLIASSCAAQQDWTQYVNVFSGTTMGGNMFPGVTAEPFAAVKLGPDYIYDKAEAYAGYLPDENAAVTGFSMLHESGIGGAPKYGVVSQMPVPGVVTNPLLGPHSQRAQKDQGSVGWYKSVLQSGVTVELAATAHAGLYSYTFPQDEPGSVVVDVSHVLQSWRGMGWAQTYRGGSISIESDGHYVGSGTYDKGWNLSPDWTIHFCGRFSEAPTSAKTFKGTNEDLSEYGQNQRVSGSERLGAVFEFNSTTVLSRVGISWISTERACQYLDAEISQGTTIQQLVDQSKAKWNEEVFSRITVSDYDDPNVPLLYTSMYGMHLIPSNRTGDNPNWQSTEPYYDDIFTFWDLFRSATPLFHILQPVAYEELLRSIIDVWRHEGWLPDARSSNYNGRTQGGSNADNVLADAYVKGVRGGINWEDAYAAMLADAEEVPPNMDDPSARDSSTWAGRGALPDWHTYGYITPQYTRAVTRAVEYSCNDFGLYQVAMGLDKRADAAKYLARSRQWRNHWNPDVESFGTRGFLVPRLANGSFVPQDAMNCGGCYWAEPYYEAKPWEYTVNAHHDLEHLIGLGGGQDAFVQRLNTLMDPANMIFNPGNQPSFATPYLYNFAKKQDLAVQHSRRVAKTYYNAGEAGLPGASDGGAMQSWVLWNMIGLYPLTGQTTFLIGSPWFSNITIKTPSGRDLVIATTGGSDTSIFVQELKVNGQAWNQNWLTFDDVFANGKRMDFVLGSAPIGWDANGMPPPSPGSSPQLRRDNGEPAVAGPASDTVAVNAMQYAEQNAGSSDGLDTRLKVAIILCSIFGALLFAAGVLAVLWWKGYIFSRKAQHQGMSHQESGGAKEISQESLRAESDSKNEAGNSVNAPGRGMAAASG